MFINYSVIENYSRTSSTPGVDLIQKLRALLQAEGLQFIHLHPLGMVKRFKWIWDLVINYPWIKIKINLPIWLNKANKVYLNLIHLFSKSKLINQIRANKWYNLKSRLNYKRRRRSRILSKFLKYLNKTIQLIKLYKSSQALKNRALKRQQVWSNTANKEQKANFQLDWRISRWK